MNIAITRERPDLSQDSLELDFAAREPATADVATVRRLLDCGCKLLCAPADVLRKLEENRNGTE